MKTYSVITLGCKVNQYESSSISASLESMGYEYRKFPEYSDVYVVNTCTVTNMSDRKSRQMIHKARTINPDCLIIVTGCLAQANPDSMISCGANIVLGNNEKPYIEDILTKALEDKITSINNVSDISKRSKYVNTRFADRWERVRGHLKIEDGCDNFCSYCVIPYVRGRVRSRELNDIIMEAEYMASKGIKEVVITGINLNSYGKDLENIGLSDVICALNEIEGIRRIRLGSLEPNVVTSEFVGKISKYTKLCPHFHMSLQSGSDKVLKDMNRHYDTEIFLDAVKLLKEAFSGIELTTDIIVGYPTETEEDFLKSIEIVEKVEFLKTHVFKFSKRKGTKAESLKELDGTTINERSQKLIEVAENTACRKMTSYIGKQVEILVEQEDGRSMTGHTRSYIKVTAKNEDKKDNQVDYVNTFIKVLVTKADQDCLYGIKV